MRRISLFLFLLPLAACQRAPAIDQGGAGQGVPVSGLERAAIETGVIADVAKVSPVGLFLRRHEAGRDLLCIAPGKDGHLRFGMEAIFGTEQNCRGQGTARRAGDKLVLSFGGGDQCIIVAQYDGDQVALPGVVDMKCADLCAGRGSLEGVSFPRVANQAAPALEARDRAGVLLCGDD